MKILLTSDWYPPVVNGVVSSILTLRHQLTERGHDVRTLTLAPQKRYTQDDFGYRLASVGAGAIYTDARVGMPPTRRILDEVVAWAPDVIHSQAEFSTFAWARRIADHSGAPLVHTYHTMYEDYTHYFSPSQRLGSAAAAIFTRGVLARTDRVVAPTRKVADLLTRYGVGTPVHVVPSGIDIDTLRPWHEDFQRRRDRREVRASLGVRDDEFLLTYVGRLAREKKIDDVLLLLAQHRALSADDPRVKLLVVGEGPERVKLRDHARALGLADVVIFAGAVPRDEVGRWYAAGDLFVSASRSETQGLTYAEAMACGLPVLCRADPCLDHLVSGGRGGWQYQDSAEFHAHLRQVLASPEHHRQLSRQARDVAEANCSAQSFGARIEDVYDLALLHGRNPAQRGWWWRNPARSAYDDRGGSRLRRSLTGAGVLWDGH